MKSRTVFSTEVVESDAFLAMTQGAQLAYFHVCSEAKPSGKIVGASRVFRSYGFGRSEMLELLDAGYLLDVDGEIFVRHTWSNNKYELRLYEIAMATCTEFQEGKIAFVGEAGKSAYCLPNVRQTNDESLPMNRSDGDMGWSVFDSEVAGSDMTGSGGFQGGETQTLKAEDPETFRCQCPSCGGAMTCRSDASSTTGLCETCGKQFAFVSHRWKEVDTGEIVA